MTRIEAAAALATTRWTLVRPRSVRGCGNFAKLTGTALRCECDERGGREEHPILNGDGGESLAWNGQGQLRFVLLCLSSTWAVSDPGNQNLLRVHSFPIKYKFT